MIRCRATLWTIFPFSGSGTGGVVISKEVEVWPQGHFGSQHSCLGGLHMTGFACKLG